MIKRFILAAAAALLVLSAAGAAQASLIGQTVNASFESTSSWSLNQTSATVSATGPEFVFTTFPGRSINVDVQDRFIDFQYNNVRNVNLPPGEFSITIGGLNWLPDPSVITGVTVTEFLDPNGSIIDDLSGPFTADFTASSVTLSFGGRFEAQDRIRVDLITGPSQQLPEPASLALFGLGLLGLGVAVRRRHCLARLHLQSSSTT